MTRIKYFSARRYFVTMPFIGRDMISHKHMASVMISDYFALHFKHDVRLKIIYERTFNSSHLLSDVEYLFSL